MPPAKAGKKVAKTKAVQKAPKTAAAVWAGKRSGKIVKGVAIAIVALITLQAIRSKTGGDKQAAADAPPFPDATPAPDPGQPTAGSAINGSAPQPDPAAPFAPPVSTGATPPHGDEAADVIEDKPDDA